MGCFRSRKDTGFVIDEMLDKRRGAYFGIFVGQSKSVKKLRCLVTHHRLHSR